MSLWSLARFLLAFPLTACAQAPSATTFAGSPQALTQQEFDDWLDVAETQDPHSIVRLGSEFLARYPHSAFGAKVHQAQMLAFEQLDNYEAAVEAGRNALRLSPEDLQVLAALAGLLPLGVAPGRIDDPRLNEAENYARRVLARLPENPGTISNGEWKQTRLRLEISAHSALGLVFAGRAQAKEAVRELQWVTSRSPEPGGLNYLRLGSAYTMARDFCAAGQAFDLAVNLGPEPIRQKAVQGKQSLAHQLSACTAGR